MKRFIVVELRKISLHLTFSLSLVVSLMFAMLLAAPVARAQGNCAALKSLTLEGVAVQSAEVVPAAAASPSPILGLPDTPATPSYCRVKAIAMPTPDSKIGFEVWMPLAGWNDELLQVGNGGLAGSIPYPAMAQGVALHDAVAGTDDGHTGSGTDGSWALGHPEKIVDFGYRAVHETSMNSRKFVKAFYGRTQRYAYFSGCSEGGREALMEAQRYPEDFNGILAGSPAADWTGLMSGFAWNAQALLKDGTSYIPAKKREAIEAAALKACGTQAGVTDAFIQYPLSCHFDPSVLLCKSSDADSCLTAPQLTALKKIYSGPADPKSGRQIYPGYQPGPEAEPGVPGLSYASYIYGVPAPPTLDLIFSSAFYGNAVAGDPKYSSLSFDFARDPSLMKTKVGAALDATEPNLQAFKAHGGKMLHYHGWYDGSPSPQSSVNYYRAVSDAMGGLGPVRDFYRLYMVPGMMHCGEGPGPNSFGNPTDTSGSLVPAHNIFGALRSWVEEDRLPGSIIATKYPDDVATKPPIMNRPLCPFPEQAFWNGKGSTAVAENFTCRLPAH